MFWFKSLLLAANLLVVSDADLNAEEIPEYTRVSWDSTQVDVPIEPKRLNGKKVLLAIHGFNNSEEEATALYRQISERMKELHSEKGKNAYDVVIGYLWPGYEDRLEYFSAKRNSVKLAKRLRDHLKLLMASGATVDVLAHSMGSRLTLEALNYKRPANEPRLVRNFYSLAPAIDNESLERGEKYHTATKNCRQVYVFHSMRDQVLKFLYGFAEFDRALGLEGPENVKKVPKNVQFIDCSTFADGHSSYFNAKTLYDIIQRQQLQKLPSPEDARELKVLTTGEVLSVP